MDVLYYDSKTDLHYKAVARSPVLSMAETIAHTPGDLLITGHEMGGGAVSSAIKQRAVETEVIMTVSAAATIHHNLENVRSAGIKIIADIEAENLSNLKKYSTVTSTDLDMARIEQIVKGLGIPFKFEVVGICAQDHGLPPAGVSHLDYRHKIFKTALDNNPFPEALIYRHNEVPETFNRLTSIAEKACELPADDIYVMDSGMAAILGASLDLQAKARKRLLVLDVATSHTVGAALAEGEIAGFFEYHTHDVTLEKLDRLIPALADGKLEHNQILKEGGHGAYLRKAFGFKAAEIIVVTGPKRRIVENSRLPITFGSPFGDNMMTGTVGLLEALRRRIRIEPISYI
jgi:uncharacterized protein (DUF1786 family)